VTKKYHQDRDERDTELRTRTTDEVLLELQRLQKVVGEYDLNNYHDVLRYLLDREEHSELEVREKGPYM